MKATLLGRRIIRSVPALLVCVATACSSTVNRSSKARAALRALQAVPVDSICRDLCTVVLASPVVGEGRPGAVTDSFRLPQPAGAVLRNEGVRLVVTDLPQPLGADSAGLRAYVQQLGSGDRIRVLVVYLTPRGGYVGGAVWVLLQRRGDDWDVVSVAGAES